MSVQRHWSGRVVWVAAALGRGVLVGFELALGRQRLLGCSGTRSAQTCCGCPLSPPLTLRVTPAELQGQEGAAVDEHTKTLERLTRLLEERRKQYEFADIVVPLEGEDGEPGGAPVGVVAYRCGCWQRAGGRGRVNVYRLGRVEVVACRCGWPQAGLTA